jgi:hypothetical protein
VKCPNFRPKSKRARPGKYRVVVQLTLWAEPWRDRGPERPEAEIVGQMLRDIKEDIDSNEVYSLGGTSYGMLGEGNKRIVSCKPLRRIRR